MVIEWSVFAIEDRIAIFEYIENDSPRAAARMDDRICEQIESLARFPELGRIGRVQATRGLILGHTPYIATYQLSGDTVRILRILHAAQEWPEAFESA